MNLKYLLSTLHCASAETLTHFALGTLSENAVLALGFDPNKDPHILFVANVTQPKCPPYISSGLVFFRDLHDIATKLAALNLDHDQAIARLDYSILALLSTRLSEANTAQDDRVWQLVGTLSNYAVRGIYSGIATAQQPANKPAPAPCAQPQSN